jgi:TM2 domain-containing membrane protein YozV
MKSIVVTIVIAFISIPLFAQNEKPATAVKEMNNTIYLKPATPKLRVDGLQKINGVNLNEVLPPMTVTVPTNMMQSGFVAPSTKSRLTPDVELNLEAMYQTERKDPALSTTLSMLVPGLGQIYNGQVLKGVGFLAVSYGSLGMAAIASSRGDKTLSAVGFSTAAVAYVWSFVDALLTSNAKNKQKGMIDVAIDGKNHLKADPSVTTLRDQKGNIIPGTTNAGLSIAYAF